MKIEKPSMTLSDFDKFVIEMLDKQRMDELKKVGQWTKGKKVTKDKLRKYLNKRISYLKGEE